MSIAGFLFLVAHTILRLDPGFWILDKKIEDQKVRM
jgi:hypothetical protein